MLIEDDGGCAVDHIVDLLPEAAPHCRADAAVWEQQIPLHRTAHQFPVKGANALHAMMPLLLKLSSRLNCSADASCSRFMFSLRLTKEIIARLAQSLQSTDGC